MYIRLAKLEDYRQIADMYSDWPLTARTGPMDDPAWARRKVFLWIKESINYDQVRMWVGCADQSDIDSGRATELDIPVTCGRFSVDLENNQAVVQNVVTHPDYRGKGYFSDLEKMMLEHDAEFFGIDRDTFQILFEVMEAAEPIAHRITDNETELSDPSKERYKLVGESAGETGKLIVGKKIIPKKVG